MRHGAALGSFLAEKPPAAGDPAAPECETVVKPQMKKYRSLWCVSTINHNILYFIVISRTSPLNTVNRLWKVAGGLVSCGFCQSGCTKIGENRASRRLQSPIPSVFPQCHPHKAQEQCSLSGFLVQMWTMGMNLAKRKSAPRTFAREADCSFHSYSARSQLLQLTVCNQLLDFVSILIP
jgi:hypothetical protein